MTAPVVIYSIEGVLKLDQGHWLAPSESHPGDYHTVTWHTSPRGGVWFSCSCRYGTDAPVEGGRRMGTHYERPCRHVRAVAHVETVWDQSRSTPRPAAPVNVSALVD